MDADDYFAVEFPLQPIIGGDYADRFQKVDGQWRFIERRIRNDQVGDLSAAPARSGA